MFNFMKRLKEEKFDIIDINEDDIKGDPRTWLTKAMTEEEAPRPSGTGPKGKISCFLFFFYFFNIFKNSFRSCEKSSPDHLPGPHGQGEGVGVEAGVVGCCS